MSHQPYEPQQALATADLLVLADVLDDIEKTRIAVGNRRHALTHEEVVGDKGGWYGKALPADEPLVVALGGVHDALASTEHQVDLQLRRALRQHPLGPWVKRTIGLGERQMARLLAALGDPLWNTLEDRPRRGPAELWAYCGYVPGQKRKRGEKSNWNAAAKSRSWLVAVSCIKQARSPYRKVYDDRRARTTETQPEWTDGHRHNDALRIVAKTILRDVWIESRRAIDPPIPKLVTPGGTPTLLPGHGTPDAQRFRAGEHHLHLVGAG